MSTELPRQPAITAQTVMRVAQLAALELNAEEAAPLAEELGAILHYVDRISDAQLTGPIHTTASLARRPDEPVASQPHRLTEIAPSLSGSSIQVPVVVPGTDE